MHSFRVKKNESGKWDIFILFDYNAMTEEECVKHTFVCNQEKPNGGSFAPAGYYIVQLTAKRQNSSAVESIGIIQPSESNTKVTVGISCLYDPQWTEFTGVHCTYSGEEIPIDHLYLLPTFDQLKGKTLTLRLVDDNLQAPRNSNLTLIQKFLVAGQPFQIGPRDTLLEAGKLWTLENAMGTSLLAQPTIEGFESLFINPSSEADFTYGVYTGSLFEGYTLVTKLQLPIWRSKPDKLLIGKSDLLLNYPLGWYSHQLGGINCSIECQFTGQKMYFNSLQSFKTFLPFADPEVVASEELYGYYTPEWVFECVYNFRSLFAHYTNLKDQFNRLCLMFGTTDEASGMIRESTNSVIATLAQMKKDVSFDKITANLPNVLNAAEQLRNSKAAVDELTDLVVQDVNGFLQKAFAIAGRDLDSKYFTLSVNNSLDELRVIVAAIENIVATLNTSNISVSQCASLTNSIAQVHEALTAFSVKFESYLNGLPKTSAAEVLGILSDCLGSVNSLTHLNKRTAL